MVLGDVDISYSYDTMNISKSKVLQFICPGWLSCGTVSASDAEGSSTLISIGSSQLAGSHLADMYLSESLIFIIFVYLDL